MTVCQFFLQGRCRFGQNCRFEHTYNNDDRSNRNPVNSQQLSNIVKQMVEEVILAEKGGQWPLSSFSPVRGGPSIPGWDDVSPEEVRWKMYEARANGNLSQCIHEINQMYNKAEKMRNLIKEPTMERVNLIVNLLKGKREPSNSSHQFSNSLPSSSIFGGSTQSTGTQNLFRSQTPTTGSHGSIFGGSSSPGNVFGGSSQSNANIFGGSGAFSNQNIFVGSNSSNTFSQNSFPSSQNSSQNLFSSSSSGSGNIFSNATVSGQNLFSNAGEGKNQNVPNAFLPSNSSRIFSNQTSSGSLFGSNSTFTQSTESQNRSQSNLFGASQNENIFTTQNSFTKSSNIFNTQQGQSRTIFGGNTQQNSISNNEQPNKIFDSLVYSKLEDLNEEEVKSFTSATFIFGKIPLKPPPKEYCK